MRGGETARDQVCVCVCVRGLRMCERESGKRAKAEKKGSVRCSRSLPSAWKVKDDFPPLPYPFSCVRYEVRAHTHTHTHTLGFVQCRHVYNGQTWRERIMRAIDHFSFRVHA